MFISTSIAHLSLYLGDLLFISANDFRSAQVAGISPLHAGMITGSKSSHQQLIDKTVAQPFLFKNLYFSFSHATLFELNINADSRRFSQSVVYQLG